MRPRSSIFAIFAGFMMLVWTAPAPAQTMTPPQRAEFNRLVSQRNKLFVRLVQLDTQAAQQMKQGRDAIVVHAEQVSVQDQLDLLELRLSLLAARHDVAVPPPPNRDADQDGNASAGTDAKVAAAFSRGRARALARVRADTARFLASLDFTAFLATSETAE